MLLRVKNAGGGVNRDLLPSELAPEMWSDCQNMRPRNGFMSRRNGFYQVYSTPTVAPYFLTPYLTTSTRFMCAAGVARTFVHEAGTQTEITRYTDGAQITSITHSGTTATVTTATAHGRSVANSINVYGAYDGSALSANYNGQFSIASVPTATTFTYTMPGSPSADATVDSATGYEYRVQSNFTGAIDDKITGGSFNGILVLNYPQDGIYYWAGDTTKRLRRAPGWLAGWKADAIFFYKNYIFALGATINGVKYPQKVVWGSAAEPGAMPSAWIAAATNDAGDNPLPAETGGPLIDGCTFGDTAYSFDSDGVYGAQLIGGNDVFRFFRLPGVDGVIARHCLAVTPKGIVYLSNGDVKLFDGASAISIAEGRMRDSLQTLVSNNGQRCFLALNLAKNEVWVCFPTAGDTTCTMAYVWNWDSDAWGIFTIPNLTCATTGLLINDLVGEIIDDDTGVIDEDFTTIDQSELAAQQQTLVVASTTKIGLADYGNDDFGTAISWYLERRGLEFGDDDSMKMIRASRWHFNTYAGATISIYHGAAKLVDSAPTYATASTYTHGTTDWVNRFTSMGRDLAVKISGSGASPVSVRSYTLDVAQGGRF